VCPLLQRTRFDAVSPTSYKADESIHVESRAIPGLRLVRVLGSICVGQFAEGLCGVTRRRSFKAFKKGRLKARPESIGFHLSDDIRDD
jgi:hypothetical protein